MAISKAHRVVALYLEFLLGYLVLTASLCVSRVLTQFLNGRVFHQPKPNFIMKTKICATGDKKYYSCWSKVALCGLFFLLSSNTTYIHSFTTQYNGRKLKQIIFGGDFYFPVALRQPYICLYRKQKNTKHDKTGSCERTRGFSYTWTLYGYCLFQCWLASTCNCIWS